MIQGQRGIKVAVVWLGCAGSTGFGVGCGETTNHTSFGGVDDAGTAGQSAAGASTAAPTAGSSNSPFEGDTGASGPSATGGLASKAGSGGLANTQGGVAGELSQGGHGVVALPQAGAGGEGAASGDGGDSGAAGATGGDGGASGTAGSGGISGAGGTGGSNGAGGSGGALPEGNCSVADTAPTITIGISSDEILEPQGGTIVSGSYFATSVTFYTTTASCGGDQYREHLEIVATVPTGSLFDGTLSAASATTSVRRWSFGHQRTGHTLLPLSLCGDAEKDVLAYNATPTTFTIFRDGKACGLQVFEYTKQP